MATIKTDLKTADQLFKNAWANLNTHKDLLGQQIDECFFYRFPCAGDYHFEVFLYETLQEASIRAVPLSSKENSPSWNFFWYRPYEIVDYTQPHDLLQALSRDLYILLTSNTRIQQTRSLFAWTFHASAHLNDGWQGIYSVGCLRRKKNRVPNADASSWDYQSGPCLIL